MGGPTNRFGYFGEGRNLVPPPGFEPLYLGFPVRIVVNMPNRLYPAIMRYINGGVNWWTMHPKYTSVSCFYVSASAYNVLGSYRRWNNCCFTTSPFWSQLNVPVLRSGIWRCNKTRHAECKVLNVCIIFLLALQFAGCYVKPPSICATSKMW